MLDARLSSGPPATKHQGLEQRKTNQVQRKSMTENKCMKRIMYIHGKSNALKQEQGENIKIDEL
jgi:hypothetical protein